MRPRHLAPLAAAPLILAALGCQAPAPTARRATPPAVPAPIAADGAGGSERVLLDQMRQMAVEDAARR